MAPCYDLYVCLRRVHVEGQYPALKILTEYLVNCRRELLATLAGREQFYPVKNLGLRNGRCENTEWLLRG